MRKLLLTLSILSTTIHAVDNPQSQIITTWKKGVTDLQEAAAKFKAWETSPSLDPIAAAESATLTNSVMKKHKDILAQIPIALETNSFTKKQKVEILSIISELDSARTEITQSQQILMQKFHN